MADHGLHPRLRGARRAREEGGGKEGGGGARRRIGMRMSFGAKRMT